MINNRVANFYGRKIGRLSLLAKDLLLNLLPLYTLNKVDFENDNFSNLCKNFQQINLEIGFGSGDFLSQITSYNPQNFYLGVEVFQSGIATLLTKLQDKKLSNLKIYPNSIYDILNVLPKASFDKIYILFPDPWFKKRHHKRRIISQGNIKIFANCLNKEGALIFASDVPEYVQWTLEHFQQDNWQVSIWEYANEEQDLIKNKHIQTRYEVKALREGRKITYITAKPPTSTLLV